MPIAWGVGPAIFPLVALAWLLGRWEDKRRQARFAKWAKESGFDLALHNSRCPAGHPYFQVIDTKHDRYVRVERETGKILSARQGPGPYSGIPIENLDAKSKWVWALDKRANRYIEVERHTGKPRAITQTPR